MKVLELVADGGIYSVSLVPSIPFRPAFPIIRFFDNTRISRVTPFAPGAISWGMPTTLAAKLEEARRYLLHHFGYADFRPTQLRVVQSVLAGHDTLAVLPTGGGKSICFQIPSLVNGGLTIVVSPLISLMQDQVDALQRKGIAAAFLNSSLTKPQADRVMRTVADGSLRLLYVSPERLTTLSGELRHSGIRPTLLAVDEAHCISEWGHDFRPSYRELAKARYLLGNPPALALTGSATPEVREDITQSLRLRNARLVLGSFDRANLWFGVTRVKDNQARLAALLAILGSDDHMAIVYAPTRGQTEILARALRDHGHRASPYHAGLSPAVREQTLRAFLKDELDMVVATSAFGMGIDKPTVRLVVHWTMPPTMESYYQEAGRAGRDGRPARCILLHNSEDTALALRQLDTTFPPRRTLQRIWEKPSAVTGVSKSVLDSAERLRRELRPEEGPVDWKRIIRRQCRARERLHVMQRYAGARSCRREVMLAYFGERRENCHGCDRCTQSLRTEDTFPLPQPNSLQRERRLVPGGVEEAERADVTPTGVVQRWGKRIRRILTATPPASSKAGVNHASGMVHALEGWRSLVARERAIPAYQVLSDGALREIAERRPRDLAALSLIQGVGPRFIAKHGASLLAQVEGEQTGPSAGQAAESVSEE